ncbi:unnamed protein product [Prorocentrum cordatum]|uniref:Uncharacterized protein n=2 Tax=Prorocentrum cordatum TaxID=2364126 RepID=A0ABN9SEM4_9DINO|nr:unnamed protein product [Polarella glacialis]
MLAQAVFGALSTEPSAGGLFAMLLHTMARFIMIGFGFSLCASADLQLMQFWLDGSHHDGQIQQPTPGCQTSFQGDPCYEKVVWAMQTGISQHPDWYVPLTRDSSFEDFQRFLHGQPRLANVCPEPCSQQHSSAMLPAEKSATAPVPSQACRTAAESDPCYEKVVWAMQTGISQHPDWYVPLTRNSSFEDFQRFLHGQPRLAHLCPEPCSQQHSSAMLPAEKSAAAPVSSQACRTAAESDPCYEKVVWAMQTGISQHPDWYVPLTRDSSFEDFQRFLHGQPNLAHVCPEPCSQQHSSVLLPAERSATAPAPSQACRTVAQGDPCYERVVWAMQTGISQRPDLFVPLTRNSSFEDFQRFLHGQANELAHVCPEPCSQQHSSAMSPAEKSATAPAPSQACRTVAESDPCYEKVVWAMQTGISQHPDWYVPLTRNSSFEDFQRFLHGQPRLAHLCPEPCSQQHSSAMLPAEKSATAPVSSQACRTAAESDPCYEKVVWAMQTGISQHPDLFVPLTRNSSFEDFQRFLHGQPNELAHLCPEPCSQDKSATAPAPSQACRTVAESDPCYEKVVWAMQTGISQHPDWYVPLTRGSSFEDFQRFLHGQPRLAHVCPEPCSTQKPDDRLPAHLGTPLPTALRLGTPMPTEVHVDELLTATYPGFVRSGSNCNCGGYLKEFPDQYTTLDLCAEECLRVPGCRSFGLHPWQSIWNGHCNLYDAICDDTDGHDEGTTCTNPVPYGAIQVNFNNLATVIPTPSPTTGVCDVTDGSSPSTAYPCLCGIATCETSEICSMDSCAVPQGLTVDWPCETASIGSNYFSLLGTSVTGAPVYSNVDGTYLYWDVSCDGYERPAADQRPRWILDNDAPSMTSTMDLDGDGNCTFFGYLNSAELRGIPLGNTSWKVACDSGVISATASIEYAPVMPTPLPTLEPGKPCPCEDSCGVFPYVDLDGDGCLLEAEVNAVAAFAGHFLEMDADGDGCVNQTECALSPRSAGLPGFPITGPAECGYGYFFTEGTSVCAECTTGETRRRRSESCTECPEGKFDAGEFDSCIGGAYLTGPLELGAREVPISKDTDESGIVLMVGDGVTISSRNPGYFERFVITEKVGFGDDERRTERQEALLRKRGPFFGLDHGTNGVFRKYDAMMSACTGVNGIDLSSSYPCGCGSFQCVSGEKCDQDCGGNLTQLPSGAVFGMAGCCVGPPVSPLPTPSPTVVARGDPHLVNLQGEHFDINHGGEFDLLRIPQAAGLPAELALRATVRPEHGRPCTTYITEVELGGSWLGSASVQMRSHVRSHSRGEADRLLSLRVLNHSVGPGEVPWTNITDWADGDYVLSGLPKQRHFKVTLSKTLWHSNKEKAGALNVAGQFVVQIQMVSKQINEAAMIVVRQELPEQEHLNVAVRKLGALGRVDIGGLLGFDPHPESLEEVTPECQRHRDRLDNKGGPKTKKAWKTRWEKIKAKRTLGGSMSDTDAAAALIGGLEGRGLMCVCPTQEPMGLAGEEYSERSAGSRTEGVVADFQIGRLAEATWD